MIYIDTFKATFLRLKFHKAIIPRFSRSPNPPPPASHRCTCNNTNKPLDYSILPVRAVWFRTKYQESNASICIDAKEWFKKIEKNKYSHSNFAAISPTKKTIIFHANRATIFREYKKFCKISSRIIRNNRRNGVHKFPW